MTARIYVPGTLSLLATWLEAGGVPLGDHVEQAVEETEDAEYAALMAAAEASAALVAGAPDGRRRRVVVVGELSSPGAELPLREVAAVHVDTADDADPEDDLAWFATQELDHLVAGI